MCFVLGIHTGENSPLHECSYGSWSPMKSFITSWWENTEAGPVFLSHYDLVGNCSGRLFTMYKCLLSLNSERKTYNPLYV